MGLPAMLVLAVLGFLLRASPGTAELLSRIVFVDPPPANAWARHLKDVDDAIADRALSRAIYTWRDAYAAAIASKRWEPLAEVADRALLIDMMSVTPTLYRDEAQQLYRFALARARAAHVSDGVGRACVALQAMGAMRPYDARQCASAVASTAR
jgi:hypothetical protein